MKVRHLLIEQEENTKPNNRQTYLIQNTINNRYVRLGKNETGYLLDVLGEMNLAGKLNLTDTEILSEEMKKQIYEKFKEWGFLSDEEKKVKESPFKNLKKIHIVKFNVQKILKVVYPIYSKLFSKTGLVIWVLALLGVIGNLVYAIMNSTSAEVEVEVFQFTPLSIVLMVIGIFITTIFHEFAHAVTCIKYGGKVTEMGILLFYCIPCCYCDVTGIYSIKDKKNRAIVGGAGILVNLFMANILLLIAIVLSSFNIVSIVLYSFSVGVIFISIYNLIPFVKLDGYWILSALSGVDNLMDKSIILLYTTLFSRKDLNKVQINPWKRRLLSIYGVISLIFTEVFWIYTFYNFENTFNLNGKLAMYVFIIIICIMVLDFIKTIGDYYLVIKNNYNRILMMM